MKSFTVIVLIFLFIISCKKDCNDTGDCSAEEVAWIPYQNAQMLVFQNDSLVRETLYVQRNSYYVDFPPSGDNCVKSQSITATVNLHNNYLMIEARHEINYPKFDPSPNLQTKSSRDFFKDHPDSIDITINNINYSNVRLIHGGVGTSIDPSNIYYSKTKGILSFQIDSVKWSLVN